MTEEYQSIDPTYTHLHLPPEEIILETTTNNNTDKARYKKPTEIVSESSISPFGRDVNPYQSGDMFKFVPLFRIRK